MNTLQFVADRDPDVEKADVLARRLVEAYGLTVSTEIHAAFTRGIAGATGNDPRPALRAGRDAVAAVAEERIDLLGAAGRA